MNRRTYAAALAFGLLLLTTAACAEGEDSSGRARTDAEGAAEGTTELRLDWAYYNPQSLVLKDKGWLEEALEAKGLDRVKVSWTQSLGSNKANENLRAGAVDFGSTAGTPALLARANGTPLKTVDVYSRPEWSSLVVAKGSKLKSVEDLKGRKVAVTKGTDPYFFLLQALRTEGLDADDVTVVNLQHPDGKTALERGQVDAWAGLDPYLSQSQLDNGSQLIYRNLGFNSYGFLNVSEKFLDAHPDLVQIVVDSYEKARSWIQENPRAAEKILAGAAKIEPAVAAQQLTERTHFDISPVPGAAQTKVLKRIAPLLVSENLVADAKDVDHALDTLYAPEFARKAAAS
ncbi:aliphatic sulfonate ABC transporter substrate-binding protein [Streptomyces sp. NBC_00638]|uniref:aliphatic sulfonate ABC transporter substrate-binding protein n=1 Tax=unclassified Streptomyces TaxID=2593676 RepID=UPI00224F9AA4|nr:aliphatic sulfonate ABC transporter substrate-binding protein [Streptomyces sp. NBC_00638]MCX5008801.1 aliphatic sulfonate ABC transporter substrate-binding protein [Streptomyces sp. NBC_00638]